MDRTSAYMAEVVSRLRRLGSVEAPYRGSIAPLETSMPAFEEIFKESDAVDYASSEADGVHRAAPARLRSQVPARDAR